jgi:hypothetical protein
VGKVLRVHARRHKPALLVIEAQSSLRSLAARPTARPPPSPPACVRGRRRPCAPWSPQTPPPIPRASAPACLWYRPGPAGLIIPSPTSTTRRSLPRQWSGGSRSHDLAILQHLCRQQRRHEAPWLVLEAQAAVTTMWTSIAKGSIRAPLPTPPCCETLRSPPSRSSRPRAARRAPAQASACCLLLPLVMPLHDSDIPMNVPITYRIT